MGYRCVNDPFNYCSGPPEWGEPPKHLGPGFYSTGGGCKLDPKTCGKHQTIIQQLKGTVLPEGSSYRHTQAAQAKPRKKKGK